MSYTQLTEAERYQIYALKKAGYSKPEIARELTRHKATIYRELNRNTGSKGYRAKQAQELALARRLHRSKSRITRELWIEVRRLIRKDWSPEQVSARLLAEQSIEISPEWIYQYIYRDKGNQGDLHEHLRCRKKRKKRYGSYSKRGQIADRVSIHERPAAVEAKSRIGDWGC